MTESKRVPNTIGSKPPRRESPKETDPKTESLRETLRGNPFGKKYHGKTYGE